MRAVTAAVTALVWTLLACCGGFGLGYYVRGARQATKEVQTLRTATVAKEKKDRQALAAGVRTEKAATGADQAFQKIRSNYEADLHKNPRAGCVLDADSLRRWNDANAESDTTAGEPVGEVPAPAEAAAGAERGNEPH